MSSLKGNNSTSISEIDTEYNKEQSYIRLISSRFLRHKLAVIGLILFTLIILISIFAPLLAPSDPYVIGKSFEKPSFSGHWLGTDQSGRDVLSRLIYGSRVSIIVGVGAVSVYVVIGVVLGLIAGYFGGWIDMIIMRITDVFMSFPYLMVILVLVSILGPDLLNIVIVLGALGWPPIARLVRGSVLSVKEMEFIKAGIALGYSTPRILLQHVLPNTLAPVLVNATFGIAAAIITEASLSFLGMGVQPPLASWGNMLTEAQSITVLATQPWLWIPPGMFIVIAVLSVNFMGDGLRDSLDPRSNM